MENTPSILASKAPESPVDERKNNKSSVDKDMILQALNQAICWLTVLERELQKL